MKRGWSYYCKICNCDHTNPSYCPIAINKRRDKILEPNFNEKFRETLKISHLGLKQSSETKNKHSLSIIKTLSDPLVRARYSEAHRGKRYSPMSDKGRENIRKAHLGKWLSKEHSDAISRGNAGKHQHLRDLQIHGCVSPPQKSLYLKILKIFPEAKQEFRIKINDRKYRYADIALPLLKIDIEVDGKMFHSNKHRDEERDRDLKEVGWSTIRIKAEDVNNFIAFKEKIDLPKIPKMPNNGDVRPVYPPMPEETIMRALQHAIDEVGADKWEDKRVAMPAVAKHLNMEGREHNYEPPRDLYKIYINTPKESILPKTTECDVKSS